MRLVMICFWMMMTFQSAWAYQTMQAVTYRGTIGNEPIIAEFAKSGDDTYVGRYAFRSQGIDIVLYPFRVEEHTGSFILTELGKCVYDTPSTPDCTTASDAPEWNLKNENNDLKITGTWRNPKTGQTLPIMLSRKGQREFNIYSPPLDPHDLLSYEITGQPGVAKPSELPYEFLRMDYAFEKGKSVKSGEIVYRMDYDPRVDLDYPVIEKIAQINIAPLNFYLSQQRVQFELPSFMCLAWSYPRGNLPFAGLGQVPNNGYEEKPSIEIKHFTKRLMVFVEEGNFYCKPYEGYSLDYRFVDVQTGKALAPQDFLKDWVAKDRNEKLANLATVKNTDDLVFGPNQALVNYVVKNRQKFDTEIESTCSFDLFLSQEMRVYFTKDDLVFQFWNKPISAGLPAECYKDILTIPIKDARFLLTEKGAQYFEVLDR